MSFCIFYDADQVRSDTGKDIEINIRMPAIMLLNPGKADYFLKPKTTEDAEFWAKRAFIYQMSNHI